MQKFGFFRSAGQAKLIFSLKLYFKIRRVYRAKNSPFSHKKPFTLGVKVFSQFWVVLQKRVFMQKFGFFRSAGQAKLIFRMKLYFKIWRVYRAENSHFSHKKPFGFGVKGFQSISGCFKKTRFHAKIWIFSQCRIGKINFQNEIVF